MNSFLPRQPSGQPSGRSIGASTILLPRQRRLEHETRCPNIRGAKNMLAGRSLTPWLTALVHRNQHNKSKKWLQEQKTKTDVSYVPYKFCSGGGLVAVQSTRTAPLLPLPKRQHKHSRRLGKEPASDNSDTELTFRFAPFRFTCIHSASRSLCSMNRKTNVRPTGLRIAAVRCWESQHWLFNGATRAI